MSNVLVVAFDGLDKELIEEFELENIPQSEFGDIDNRTGIYSIHTSELFASFITGKNWEEHGVKKLRHSKDPKKEKIRDFLFPDFFLNNFRGFTRLKKAFEGLIDISEPVKYRKMDWGGETLFDEIENSRAMFVPSYNPSIFWRSNSDISVINYGYTSEEIENYIRERAFEIRKNKLFHELENEIVSPRDFLMCHFHFPDWIHHLYADKEADVWDGKKLREIYREIDELAGEIEDKALEKGYERVIFMSDHGVPTESEHNENAFYSCNQELFTDKVPHITDFYDKVLELAHVKTD